MSKQEQVATVKLQALLRNYLYIEYKTLHDELLDKLTVKSKLLERKPMVMQLTTKVLGFREAFVSGLNLGG
ncbi:hypothetical protein [Pontibacter roseus]|uniref:hypothetical protein n=1 Tax=Pontibacter roseus TaxID=336989 RepID=UPI00035FC7CA|nr:hypothetical protein [Pontibacter roseus]